MLHTLENHVRPLTALFEEALADGGLAPVPTSRAATPQRTKAGNYPFICGRLFPWAAAGGPLTRDD